MSNNLCSIQRRGITRRIKICDYDYICTQPHKSCSRSPTGRDTRFKLLVMAVRIRSRVSCPRTRIGIWMRLRTVALRVQLPPRVLRPLGGTVYALVSEARTSEFESRSGYADVSQQAEETSSNLVYVRFRIPPSAVIISERK